MNYMRYFISKKPFFKRECLSWTFTGFWLKKGGGLSMKSTYIIHVHDLYTHKVQIKLKKLLTIILLVNENVKNRFTYRPFHTKSPPPPKSPPLFQPKSVKSQNGMLSPPPPFITRIGCRVNIGFKAKYQISRWHAKSPPFFSKISVEPKSAF